MIEDTTMTSMREELEPMTGIGPAYPAWKAGVLPLNYTDIEGTSNREK